MTNKANTMSQLIAAIIIINSASLFAEPVATKPATTASAASQANTKDAPLTSADLLKKIQIIQIPAQQLNFKFDAFTTRWMTSEGDWKEFWKSSRMTGDAIKLPVNWKTETVLAVFWEGKDAVVRIPSFSGSEILSSNGVKKMKLNFNLNSPCMGIIDDTSPVQLLVIDASLGDMDQVVIHTDKTKTLGCF